VVTRALSKIATRVTRASQQSVERRATLSAPRKRVKPPSARTGSWP